MKTNEESTIILMMKNHFLDDEKSFKALDIRLNKIEELFKVNGEHFSYFNKNLEEIKNILATNAKSYLEFKEYMQEHVKRVEPVIKGFEEKQIAEKLNIQMGDKMLRYGKYVATASLIGGTTLYLLRKFI